MSEPTSESRACPKCGAALPSAATAGLCPRCLMAEAMEPTQTEAEPATPQKTLSPEELAPHFPQLEILECLGRGGMGVVYKARQKTLNRVVALKLLAPERVADAGFAERFTREAQALAALNHPSIVTIYDFGTTTPPRTPDAISHPPFFFLLMEFVDGVNLRQAMKAGRFTPEQALAVVPPVCEALQYAHEHGIVHRDIKPENLLLDKDGRVKIADFGIAKMLHADGSDVGLAESQPVGTPQYMAPEQKEHRRTDHRADIYSLGVVLYELLTGEMPADKLQPPSRRVQIDVRLDEIVLRALEQKPELRYQTASDLRTQVETFERADREARIEKSKQPPALSSIISPLSSPPPPPARFLKVGTSTLTTPARLATVSGQLFHNRTRGQLVLDDRQLTHTAPPALGNAVTVIPLAAIRDVSIGKYPRSMNPLGIDLLSVTYEEGGQRKQVLLSPMEGYFAMPGTWDARVAEWATAIRETVTAATGRAPTTTPAEQLGVPGSHVVLLKMFLMALVPLGVFVACLTALTSPGAARHNTSLLSTFAIGIAAFGFFLLFTKRRWMKSPTGSAPPRSPWRIALGVFALVAVLPIAALLTYFLSHTPSSGVSSFICIPVGVSNSVVIVDVNAEVAAGGAEVQAALDGPRLSPTTEAALAETFFPPFAGTFVKPTPYVGNRPWRIWQAGPQTWRLGFALPDAALAKEAFENLRPIGPLPAQPRRTFAGTLFEVGQPGAEYRASLNVTPPVGANDPNWVSTSVTSTYNESGVNMNWQVEASQPGTVLLRQEGGRSTASLKRDPKSKLHLTSVSLELTKVGTNRVLFVSRIGGVTARQELSGSFRDLSAELLRYVNMSTKTVRGAEIELCQFQGKPVTVQVDVLPSTVTTPAAGTSPAIQRVEISQDKAVVHTARYDGSGLLITLGKGTNRWTPSGRYLDGLFNVTLEWPKFGSGARHVIQPRHGIHMNYRLDGPPGPMLGKLVFHPGSALPDAGGSCVIGEYQPETGEPLPIAVEFVPDQATPVHAASAQTTGTSKSYPATVKAVDWSVPFYGVIGLCVIGGIVLIIVLVRKGGTAGKVVALLCVVPVLLLAVVLVSYLSMRAGRVTDAEQQALSAARAEVEGNAQQQGSARAIVTSLLLDTDGKPMPLTTLAFMEAGGTISKGRSRGQIASGETDDLGFVHTFDAPPDRPWEIVVLRDGEEIMRSAPIRTPVSVNPRGGPPNYFLELRVSGETPGEVLLTPLSSEANQAAPAAASDQVFANRLALASLLQKLHHLPATSDEKGTLWLPVPGAAVPVPKRVEVAAQIERLRRLIRAGGDGKAASPTKVAARSASATRTFPLRHKLGSVMVDDLRQILLGGPGQEAKPSADNQQVVITAPSDALARAQTFITVTDWPDKIARGANYEYPRQTVLRAARSFFHACALADETEAISNQVSLFVLAQLKGETKSEHYFKYNTGGVPDPEWEKSLRADWPGKQEAIQRLVREWNRYPLKRITEDSGVAMGFGVKHFCSVAFEGAPKEFYQVTIEPERTKPRNDGEGPFYFSSLPPWWKDAPGEANPPPPQPVAAPLIRREVKQPNPGGKNLDQP